MIDSHIQSSNSFTNDSFSLFEHGSVGCKWVKDRISAKSNTFGTKMFLFLLRKCIPTLDKGVIDVWNFESRLHKPTSQTAIWIFGRSWCHMSHVGCLEYSNACPTWAAMWDRFCCWQVNVDLSRSSIDRYVRKGNLWFSYGIEILIFPTLFFLWEDKKKEYVVWSVRRLYRMWC